MFALRPKLIAFTLTGWTALAGASMAHEFNLGELFVDHPHILLPNEGDMTAVGLVEIHNRTSETEQLTDVRGDGITLFHHVEVGEEMRMVPVDRLAIPRGKTIGFSEEALHVVIEVPEEGFQPGDLVASTFVFDRAGEMDVIFVVEDSAAEGHSH